jgi:hypothetical protein
MSSAAVGSAAVPPWQRFFASPPIPDRSALDAVQRFCALPHPYRSDAEVDALFVAAMNEVVRWHADRSPVFGGVWSSAGSTLLSSVDDLPSLPFLHANLFKQHDLASVDERQVEVVLSSSGTTGVPSRMPFDAWSMRTFQRMDARTFEFNGWIGSPEPVDYVIFGYEPRPNAGREAQRGAAYGLDYICSFAPLRSVTYALRTTGTGGHEPDLFSCVDALLRATEDGTAARLFGFPAYLVSTLDLLARLGLSPLKLAPDSLVLLGGGWKGNEDRRVDKDVLYGRIEDELGVPPDRIRDIWGSVEHPLPYYECPDHRFHVPTWARLLVRDVRTLDAVADGEPGFLQLVSPYVTSAPAHSLLMPDLVSRHPAGACGCGLPTPWFTVHGRAGTSRNNSCAVAASELLGAGR